jgi:hypothetical protein|tara:strand:- start:431 stop:682 length:252 start_codon:yes stop_codon:yes gene_type:complete
MLEEYISGDAMRDEKPEVPKWDRECKNKCGAYGFRWGSKGGYCTNCKHTANVGCQCTLEGCSEIYWSMTKDEKRMANKRGKEC